LEKTVHSLDVDDYLPDGPALKLEHRPETNTRLKNEYDSERRVFISEATASIIDSYIDDKREDVTDEYGRKPLITSKYGRPQKTTLRNYVYRWTEPCQIGKDCPFGKEDISKCDAARRLNDAHKCPGSKSPHPVRKGYITAELNAGVLIEVLSGRCDVSPETLKKHYDLRSEEEQMRARKEMFEKVHKDKPGYGE
jgi:integrase